MTYTVPRMKFGIFLAPFHRVGENPTVAMQRDMELIQHLDALDYDEAWIGEHHSYGRELIADPAMFIAAAAVQTRRIRLGTGVVSLPYHHPLMVADRMVQLDHMTRGRAMLGVGPGALVSDARMMGIETVDQRRMMNESLDAIMQLLEAKAPVTMETDWFKLEEARLQLASYSRPHLEVAVAASFTPSGPTAAGKHGTGLLSVAGADDKAFERTWGWVEESAAESGRTVDRADWKVVVPIHIAETKQQAIDDVAEGFKRQAYVGDRRDGGAGQPIVPFAGGASSIPEAVEKGSVIVGSPDDAIQSIKVLQERSGGIGGLLGLAHEWASTDKTNKSYELFARYVAPRFQGQIEPIEANRDWIEGKQAEVFSGVGPSYVKAFQDAGKELPASMLEAMEKRRSVAAQAQEAQQQQ